MKKNLLSFVMIAVTFTTFAQKNLWKSTSIKSNTIVIENKKSISTPKLFELNIEELKSILANSVENSIVSKQSNITVPFPNADGLMENFRVYELSNMDPALAARYPEIKSYVGQGIDNPSSSIYFSVSPLGLQTMVLNADKSAVFMEPYTTDLSTYVVYKKSDKAASLNKFECSVIDILPKTKASVLRPNADDAILRTFRLALSVTGEYTTYFGGTKALALAAMNNSMTRVNGVFEKDFSARMVLIANNDVLIYTSATTDPYSAAASMANWNKELQNNLTAVIGNANYDIGHLFGASGGGGNAGCIGCICVDDTASTTDLNKGSGYTSPGDGIPMGDNFDIDYVAHEMGHQFGGNHTFTHSNEGTGVQVEPGSGSTIMGYAGITSLDVQPHSDPFFHAVTIQQVTNNIKSKTCSVNTATGNAIPTASAGLDYTIPKSTPFMLTAVGTDANGDALTYNWEEMDSQTTAAVPSATKTTGVNFRSYNATTSPTRYFPRMASVLTGATTTAGTELTVEALSSVARTLNFRVTVRDNRVGGSGNNSDDMIVTVNATAGPFSVSAPNTAVSYAGGSSQTVTWVVGGTTANNVNCANVDILLSTDGGLTFPTTLLAATPNDGTQAVIIPNLPGTTNRIMVKGTNHIFFDVSNTNFTITSGNSDTTAPKAPILVASGTAQTTTNLSWSGATDNVAVTGYDVYKGTVLLGSTTTTTYAVTELTASTAYTFSVKAKDAAGNISVSSNVVSVTTLAPVVDATAPTAPILVASGTTQTTTNLSWSGATDNVAVTGYDVYKGTVLLGSTATTTFAVTGLTAASTYTFYVKAKDTAGNISVSSNVVTVTTTPNTTITYCASTGTSTADEKIGKVVFGTISNISTGTAGYENFSALSTNAIRGTAYTITITPTWTSTVYSEGYAVFIDYNGNGLFTDAGETVWTKSISTTTPVTGSFTIPLATTLGAKRMRVSMKYNGIPTSCETIPYGQVEDYTVNVSLTARMSEIDNNSDISFNLYPNPVTTDVLNVSNLDETSEYSLFNLMGQELGKGKIENESEINVGLLTSGTYLITISNKKGSTTKRFIKQ